MKNHMTRTRYPIICSPMNGVSDVRLAVACYHAGILPSLVPYCYSSEENVDFELFEAALLEYANATNFGPLLIACDVETFGQAEMFSLLVKYRVPFVEILNCKEHNAREMYRLLDNAKKHNITVIPKILSGADSVKKIFDNIGPLDCVTLKGPQGGGRGSESIVLEDEIVKIKHLFPDLNLIVSGGINNSHDIKKMLALGADAVSLGTIFCACEESSLSAVSKQKIIDSTYSQVKNLDTGACQKALVFSTVAETDINNTNGLLQGVSTGQSGHIFIGTGIDYVDSVKTVKQIVSDLIKDL